MNNHHLYVFAKIILKPQFFSDGRNAIRGIIEPTRREAGCIQFELHQDEAASTLFLYEEWNDSGALEEHYSQPYTKNVFENYSLWLAQPIEIHKMMKL